MGKKWAIIATLIIGIILAIICGVYAYRKGGISEPNIVSEKELAESEELKNTQVITNEVVITSSDYANISPNAIIIQKKYYKSCDHLIREVIDIPEKLINKDETEVAKQYPGWKIENYSPTEIAIYKEFNGFCNEHYVIKEHNGYIGIYCMDEHGTETWKEDTEISTIYLPEQDLENLKTGISIVGEKNLYSFLEDYE